MVYGDYPDLSGVKKILVVKLRQLGDVLLTGAVFEGLRNRFPEAQIDAYVYKEAFAMLEGDRGVLAARAARARVRVGFEPKGRWQKKVYTHVVKHCPGLRHTVERNLDALRRIGIFPGVEERELFLEVTEEARVAMRERVEGPFVVIHPTSRWRFKCWPVEKMRKLTEELVRRGKQVVFTSGPDAVEREMVGEIVKGLDVVNLSGQISLKELAALIEGSELLVCVDSVPFHMASALKKRVVAIFGPTSDVTWGPWRNEGARVVAQPFSCRPCYQDGCGGSKMSDCLATLPVGLVLRAIDESLRRDRCGEPVGR
jgi:heptosyltransferase-3